MAERVALWFFRQGEKDIQKKKKTVNREIEVERDDRWEKRARGGLGS